TGSARGADRGEDPTAGGVQLLVARPRRAPRELVDPVAGEAGVRMAVDEPRDGGSTPAVELDDLVAERPEVSHPADGCDGVAVAEEVGILDDLDLGQRRASKRSPTTRGRDELRQVADEQPGRPPCRADHSRETGGTGSSSPWLAACSIASA